MAKKIAVNGQVAAKPRLEYDALLSDEAESLVADSAMELLSEHPEIWGDPDDDVVAEVLRLRGLDRLGGAEGHGGSRVFVGCFEGATYSGEARTSIPLLLKVVENNPGKARTLLEEKPRYQEIQRFFKWRDIARSYLATRRGAAAVLWTEFFGEGPALGMPKASTKELRHAIESEHWKKCERILRATYEMLQEAHGAGTLADINFIEHYDRYLRLDQGCHELALALGTVDEISVLGMTVRNPSEVLRQLRASPIQAKTKCAAVHGDLHPRNVMMGRNQLACLIDWGRSRRRFHVIVDYVLMELSVKFFYLPWHLTRDDVVRWEEHLSSRWRQPLRVVSDDHIRGATRLIRLIRQFAEPHVTDVNNPSLLTVDYFLPLFLLTMGTFTFARDVSHLDHLLLAAGLLAARVEHDLDL